MRRLVKSAPLPEAQAWVHPMQYQSYDLTPLLLHTRTTDLWDNDGEVTISLQPGNDPIIRVKSYDDPGGSKLLHLVYPSHGRDDLVRAHNLFAFLGGKPLVALKDLCSTLDLFVALAESIDDLAKSTSLQVWGDTDKAELLTHRLANYPYLTELTKSDDVIVALRIAELFQCESLYVVAYTDCVSRYHEISHTEAFQLIGERSRTMIDSAGRETHKRLVALARGLEAPSITTIFVHAPRPRVTFMSMVRHRQFSSWKDGFMAMQSFIKRYYHKCGVEIIFGAESFHLSHISLLYRDLCTLYDLLVDLQAPCYEDPAIGLNNDQRALRRILEGYDSAEPPRKPSMPFWIPKLSRCLDSWDGVEHSAFLRAFMTFECTKTAGRTSLESRNLRYGTWVYIYSILQLLPPIVSENDYPGHIIRYPSRYPWHPAGRLTYSWYRTPNSRYVKLPQSTTTAITETSYYESHCWKLLCDETGVETHQSPRMGLQSISSLDLPLRDEFTDQTFDGILERMRRDQAGTRAI